MAKRLKQSIRRLNNLMKSTADSPDAERVHKLRVLTRRLRAQLNLNKKAAREVRTLGRALGRRRELDVAIEDAKAFGLQTGQLQALRKRADARVAKALAEKRRKRLVGKLTKIVEREPARNLAQDFPRLRGKIKPWRNFSLRRKSDVHAFRIVVKKVRYALEGMDRPVEPLRKLQDHLGRVHDLERLEELVGPSAAAKKVEKQELAKARRLANPGVEFALRQLE